MSKEGFINDKIEVLKELEMSYVKIRGLISSIIHTDVLPVKELIQNDYRDRRSYNREEGEPIYEGKEVEFVELLNGIYNLKIMIQTFQRKWKVEL